MTSKRGNHVPPRFMSEPPLRVAFLHPDLGIGASLPCNFPKDIHNSVSPGGAERLVVDAALGLQKLGRSVDIYTSYHDPDHCFEETRDGAYFRAVGRQFVLIAFQELYVSTM